MTSTGSDSFENRNTSKGVEQYFGQVDELIMEYLLFRGFTKSFQTFSYEVKHDKLKKFDVDKILQQVLHYIQSYDISGLQEYWTFLKARFFSHLDDSYHHALQKLETSINRFYIIHAIQNNHKSKVTEFFTRYNYSDELHFNRVFNNTTNNEEDDIDWQKWFALPFLKNPENDSYFKVYFEPKWTETFLASFINFLTLVFQNLSLPKILSFQLQRLENQSLKMKYKAAQSECNQLRNEIAQNQEQIVKLKEAGSELGECLQKFSEQIYLDNYKVNESTPSSEGSNSSSFFKQWVNLSKTFHSDFQLSTKIRNNNNISTEILSKNNKDWSTSLYENPELSFNRKILDVNVTDIIRCQFSRTGNLFAVTGNSTEVWKSNNSNSLCKLGSNSSAECFTWGQTMNNEVIFMGYKDGNIQLWDPFEKNQQKIIQLEEAAVHISDIYSSKSSEYLVFGFQNFNRPSSSIQYWNVNQQQMIQDIPLLSSDNTMSTCLALNHMENLILSGFSDGSLKIFDLRQISPVVTWKTNLSYISEVKYSNDDLYIYVRDVEGAMIQWHIPMLYTSNEMPAPSCNYKCNLSSSESSHRDYIAFNPSGTHFIGSRTLSSGKCSSSLYQIGEPHSIYDFLGHKTNVTAVDWHTQQCNILTASQDGMIQYWYKSSIECSKEEK